MTTPALIPTPREAAVMGDPLVFASGSDRRRRWQLVGVGLVLLAVAWVAYFVLGLYSDPAVFTELAAGLLGVGLLTLAVWRRGRAFQVRREGIRLIHGGPVFGEKTLVPWESITWLGARSDRQPGQVCLVYRQQHIDRDHILPGSMRSIEEFDRLIDRLRVVLANRYPHLRLGGIA